MRYGILLLVVLGVTGCPGGDGGVGESCSSHGDCDSQNQCSHEICVPRCARAPECGDGYACDSDGICVAATGQPGDGCTSETQCSAGLSCQIDGESLIGDHLLASCTAQKDGKPPGGECGVDSDCRNNTCALGRCVDLCASNSDCAAGHSCMDIPRVEANGSLFAGCLPSSGNVIWTIPVTAPTSTILLPVPSAARFAQLVFTIDDDVQRVGAQTLTAPSGKILYKRPCEITLLGCDPVADFFANEVRHEPGLGQSVIAIPASSQAPLEIGTYRVQVSSYRPTGAEGSAIPRVTALVRIDTASLLDLRFHFLDLDDHMCQPTAFGNAKLDATAAQTAPFFQNEFVGELRTIFAHGGIALGDLSYDDIRNRPDLDSLDITNAKDLLALGTGSTGIDVFFVRSLSPVGLQAFGPSPGPAGMSHTRQSGIVIGLDTLCFRSWKQLARLAAHEVARYMGLQHNVELGTNEVGAHWTDKIDDTTDSPSNLMFYSELGGTDITPGQRDLLTRSGVLR